MDQVVMHGILSRKSGIFQSWTKYTYQIRGDFLLEFKVGSNVFKSEPLHMYELRGGFVEDANLMTRKPASFLLHCFNGVSVFLLAPSLQEKEKWLAALGNVCKTERPQPQSHKHHHQPQPQPQPQPQQQQQQPQQQQSIYQKSIHDNHSVLSNGNKTITSNETKTYNQGSDDDVSLHSGLSANTVYDDAEQVSRFLPIIKCLDSFTDAVIVANTNGIIIAVNSAAEKMFGWDKGKLDGQRLAAIMPEPYKSYHDGYIFRHEKFGDQKLIGKTRVLKGERSNGEKFELQISLGKLPANGYFIATIRELQGTEKN